MFYNHYVAILLAVDFQPDIIIGSSSFLLLFCCLTSAYNFHDLYQIPTSTSINIRNYRDNVVCSACQLSFDDLWA